MQRSLFSGVSGLTTHQSILDITANNLANISTPGFKTSRNTFSSALLQTSFGGAGPSGSVGGTNPRQVGLGVRLATSDVDMRQGALVSTGRNLDLAVQGTGFFQVSNSERTMYTRVGNFGFDGDRSLVDLSSGNKLIGNLYGENNATTPIAFNVPITVPNGAVMPSKRTSEISLQGNLSSSAKAIQGSSLQTLFPLVDKTTGEAATDDTLLSNLSIFGNAVDPVTPTQQMRTIHMFGTKADGTGWSGDISVNVWKDKVTSLLSKLNATLVSGSVRFGTVNLENGNLMASPVGTGSGFSMFMGDAVTSGTFDETYAGTTGVTNAVGSTYTGVAVGTTVALGSGAASATPDVPATETDPYDPALTRAITNVRLQPTFVMPAVDYSGAAFVGQTLTVTVTNTTTGQPLGSIFIPAADYTSSSAARTFTLSTLPQVARTDTISYSISGTLDLGAGNNLTWATNYVNPNNVNHFIADGDGDGQLNLFDLDAQSLRFDASAWQYNDTTNSTFSWYRSRFVPEMQTSAIEVFDNLGGRHVVETRMFRNGSKPDPVDPTATRNSWDLILGIKDGEGVIIDDVVSGIEFDQGGRYTGELGRTQKGNIFVDLGYVGDPSSQVVRVDWSATGTTSPSSIDLNLGSPNGLDGLTGFGSRSTMSTFQDGYPDGKIDTLSVTSYGDLIGLFTNGINKKLAQIQLATFQNQEGLVNVGSNLWIDSPNSGSPTLLTAGQGGSGSIASGSLEGSNVDIATEFTRLITAQRGFQVNARVIQTTDSVLQELAGLIR